MWQTNDGSFYLLRVIRGEKLSSCNKTWYDKSVKIVYI